MIPRKLHIIPYNEKIRRKSHFINNTQFVIHPLAHLRRHRIIPCRQCLFTKLTQIRLICFTVRNDKFRQMTFTKTDIDVTFSGNFQSRIQCLRHVRKQGCHFLAAFHIKFIIRKSKMRRIVQGTSCRDAQLYLLRRRIRLFDIMVVIGRHKLQSIFLRPLLKNGTNNFFLRQSMILNFQIKIILTENANQVMQRTQRAFFIVIKNILLYMPLNAGTHRNKPVMILFQQIIVHARLMIIIFPVHKSFGYDFHKIVISCIIFRQ